MVRNILFDMGNVIIRFDRDAILDHAGVTDGDDRALLLREVFRSVEWVRLDRGTLNDREALELMKPRLPERLWDAADKLVSFWDRPILPVPGMEALIAELAEKGFGLCLLTNASLRHGDYWPRVPASRFFEGRIMLSAAWKVIKPEAAFYEKALELFSLKPEECLFIDDSAQNVEGAERVGIRGLVFHGDAALLRSQLTALHILP